MPINHETLASLIEKTGLIKKSDLDDAQKVATHLGADISDVLLGRNLITEDDYGQILANYFNISFVNLDKVDIPHETISLVPEDIAASHNVIVFSTPIEYFNLGCFV